MSADPGQQFHHPFERDFIARIRDEANERGDILDVRLLEKSNAARDLIGNAAPRKFELQFDRVIMRAIQNRDLVQLDAFVAQFENSLGDELRLLARRRSARPAPASLEFVGRVALSSFRNCCTLARDRRVRDAQDLRHAPVVHLDLEDLRVRIALRERRGCF